MQGIFYVGSSFVPPDNLAFFWVEEFKLLLQPYPNSRITFIEIPHYSITK
jgi:hypothetical protein